MSVQINQKVVACNLADLSLSAPIWAFLRRYQVLSGALCEKINHSSCFQTNLQQRQKQNVLGKEA